MWHDPGVPLAIPLDFLENLLDFLELRHGLSRVQELSLEAFPRGFTTGLSHVPPWCESILGLKVEAVLGKQVSLEWT